MFPVTKALITNLSFHLRLPPIVAPMAPPSGVVRVYSTPFPPSPSEVSVKKVGTHNGSFHCDEALGCFMIRLVDKFSGADIVRTRDPKILAELDAVLDVGGVYDPNHDRYDHHQKGFEEVFGHGFNTKLSSAGLVYKHFGKEIIAKELNVDQDHPDVLRLFLAVYKSFMEAIDAVDNGINRYDTDNPPRYVNNTHLSPRVGRLNLDWIDPDQSQEKENEAFQSAMAVAGKEFLESVRFHARSWLPMQISGEEVSSVPIFDGDKFVYQILNGPNEDCVENFRMDKPVFYKLCDILRTRGLLCHTNRIKIEEQLAIFLFIVGHNLRTRAVQELFRYSGETISRHFNNVLNAVMEISMDFFQSNPNSSDPRFFPYFKDCVGVVDCLHIPVMVGVDEQGPFRNSNGLVTQNVLVASSFDLRFNYVLAGWEGSASDQQVLNAALTRRNNIQVPQGKYYLVDNKYLNLPGFMAPYHGVSTNSREEPNEIFNERHKLLHRTIDRTFGALKQRFPILLSAPPYPLQTQVKLVIAACALHNYVRLEKPDDLVFRMFEEDTVAEDRGVTLEDNHGEMERHEHGFRPEEMEDCLRLRDAIASDIWDHYVQNLSTF